MPLYEYSCRNCRHEFEALVTSRAIEEVQCPKCEGTELDRLFGLPAAGRSVSSSSDTNCRGDGPPCGAPWCGRKT